MRRKKVLLLSVHQLDELLGADAPEVLCFPLFSLTIQTDFAAYAIPTTTLPTEKKNRTKHTPALSKTLYE